MSQRSLPGKHFDEYKLEKKLGEGGMASVYRAMDVRLNRYAAVKVILPDFRANSDYQMRFEREAQAIAQLDHPHIVTIYRYGDVDNMLYMAMQFVDGMDLGEIIEDCRQDGVFIEFEEIIKLTQQIGSALDYAHSKGVIHRDVKPQNILINQQGNAIVSDFGLALLTEIGTYGEIFGSPHYIAPEQAISSAGVVPQSDLYALAVMIFEMLTGELPFDADEPLDIAMKHMTEELPSPRSIRSELPQAIEDVLMKALNKEPEERYATGQELAAAVEAALNAKPSAPATQKNKPAPTIAHRIELGREANPLPPLPAPVIQDTAEHQSPPTKPTPVQRPPRNTPPRQAIQSPVPQSTPVATPAPAKKSSLPVVPVIIGMVALAILGGVAFVLFFNAGNDDAIDDSTQAITIETNTDVPAIIAATTTNMPVTEPTATDIVVIPTDAPSVAAAPYQLNIRWVADDSVFIWNQSESNFPLAPLELNGNGSVSGSEWGINVLAPGQCVAVFKDSGNPQYANMACDLVGGTNITRPGAERFWVASFRVLYNGNRMTVCESSPCEVTITP